ncbi:MAG: ATP-binding protein [Stappiaceae bacterium]
MSARQRILPVRRKYNQWVVNQTLEDYALRFTAKSARRFSSMRISQTAIGAISFLALEAIGGAITLSYGTSNTIAAVLVSGLIIVLIGAPIARYAAQYGVDIDLLTRGAGFGYIGSTVTSLIYASFTFILFAIEAAIMAAALELAFGLPLWIGYILSSLAVIPLVTHGITLISRFQLLTQPFWIILNILPFLFIAMGDWSTFSEWLAFGGLSTEMTLAGSFAPLDLARFGAAAAVILALVAQIGEQVDFLRFLPVRKKGGRRRWLAVFLAGPGWVILGAPKMLAGSFLAVLALNAGISAEHAVEPAYMYTVAFGYVFPNEVAAALLTAAFVVVSQLKINVMNAYAGSLAWSNFFSRLTHSHPGRVVWLVFNVSIALLLMELGIYQMLEETLGIFSIIAMAWLSTISADLFINKKLGLSPPGIEFKRAHLYDVNPVGPCAMGLATSVALLAHFGLFGATTAALSTFIAMGVAVLVTPIMAYVTDGNYYLARKPRAHWQSKNALTCSLCENPFEPEDMAYCPAYQAPICSLCCTLDARCHDSCKPHARLSNQVGTVAEFVCPPSLLAAIRTRLGRYALTTATSVLLIGAVLALTYLQAASQWPSDATIIGQTLIGVFLVFAAAAATLAWFFVLAHDSRRVAEEERAHQTTLLLREIAAHEKTDTALQNAKETAEAANLAKSRYVVGLSHELRTPLNAVLGYAQILDRDETLTPKRKNGVRVIKRSAEHLSGLIDGLLDISRIEAGRLQVYSNEVNIADFLDQIVDMFRPQAEAKGLDFIHKRALNLPDYVKTDEKRLRQILVNLLSNAIKFTPKGRITFNVGYKMQIATFEISDTGRGISKENIDYIFDPFRRGDEEKTTRTPGLGLGLTITKLLTETLGGEVTVFSDNTPGHKQGSRFSVRLMLATVPDPKPAAIIDHSILTYEGPRKTILVTDDDQDHREMMFEILAPLGFDVISAADGESCLAVLEELEPDLFMLDISMPAMNGWELVDVLRARGQSAPILMVSANIGDLESRPDRPPQHDDEISKPYDLRQLLDKLQKHLKLTWVTETTTSAPTSEGTGENLPAPGDLAELLSLGEIGYVRGIEAKLDVLSNDNPSPFIKELRAHLSRFDLQAFNQHLKQALEEPTE